jgi:membrane protein YdbS with pleckstrin-like domain
MSVKMLSDLKILIPAILIIIFGIFLIYHNSWVYTAIGIIIIIAGCFLIISYNHILYLYIKYKIKQQSKEVKKHGRTKTSTRMA